MPRKATDPRSPSIVRTPGTCGGAPRVRGRRVTVREIVQRFLAGEAMNAIAYRLSLANADVDDAIRYHMNHSRPNHRGAAPWLSA